MTTIATDTITLYADCAGGRVVVSSFHTLGDNTQPPFADREAAQAFAALLPKSCKVRATTINGRGYSAGFLQFHANLNTNGVVGERNEAGIKRYRSLVAACERLGVTIEWTMPYSNSLTETETEALLQGVTV